MVTKTLAQKLYIRPGHTVALLNAPKGMADALAPLPDEVKVVTNIKSQPDLVLCFVKSSADLEKSATELKETLADETVLWFAYPKVSSKAGADITRDKGWKPVFDMGFVGVASVAIDNTWSALRFKRGLARTAEDAVAKQYAGERATLRPLFDQLAKIIQHLGPDVEVSARQTYVAFTRGKQFALIRPTHERVEVVMKMLNAPMDVRLEPALGVGSGSMTHRVAITTSEEIDKQLIGWLQDAYRNVTK